MTSRGRYPHTHTHKKTLLVLEGSTNPKTSGHACTKQHTKI